MLLDRFYTPSASGFQFSRQQASDFAKGIADDFNPIHDIDAKRFCVPGDLLFTMSLAKLGLSTHMAVSFSDMVSDSVDLHFNQTNSSNVTIEDAKGKVYLTVDRSGESCSDESKALLLAEEYVAFSGKTFPHILVPLWQDKDVMVNPARPLVIYEAMTLSVSSFEFNKVQLNLDDATLDVQGKRGKACIKFSFMDGDKRVASGEKHILLSGLKPYNQSDIDQLVQFYDERKQRLAIA